jgi:hypothetical protein
LFSVGYKKIILNILIFNKNKLSRRFFMSDCFNCSSFDRGIEDGQYPYCWILMKEVSPEKFRENKFGICPKIDKCNCGNPQYGFNCVCEWVKKNPGSREFLCDFCGIYRASKQKCSECEEI